MARINKILKIENGVVWMDVSTRKFPDKVTQFDEADLSLVLDGGGGWCVAEKGKKDLYVIRPGARLHRHVVGLVNGDPRVPDHINGDRLDNRRENLRVATHRQNVRNAKLRAGGSSQYKGVAWRPTRSCWRARIRVDYKQIHLGHFGDEAAAARTYDTAARELFGEFANLNFPESRAA